MHYMELTALTVYADGYRITGTGSLALGERVTDFMNTAKEFLALTDVRVWTRDGRRVLDAPFMNVNRGAVELVVPQD